VDRVGGHVEHVELAGVVVGRQARLPPSPRLVQWCGYANSRSPAADEGQVEPTRPREAVLRESTNLAPRSIVDRYCRPAGTNRIQRLSSMPVAFDRTHRCQPA